MSRALAALAALALAAGVPVRAEEGAPGKVRVAVEPLRVIGVSPDLARMVEERVCASLAELPGREVICPSDVAAAALVAMNAAVLGECASDECMKRVDAMKAADRRVSGVVEKAGNGIVLSLQVNGPEGAGPRVSGKLPGDLGALSDGIPALVKKLFP